MIFLLGIHLIVPSPHYIPVYPYWTFTWFAFSWGPNGGWVSFIQYAFEGLPAFVLIGLATIIPLILLLLLLCGRVHSTSHGLLYLVLSFALSAVYFYGWFDYTWPAPYQLVQTLSIVLYTFVAYKNWSDTKSRRAARITNNRPKPIRQQPATEFESLCFANMDLVDRSPRHCWIHASFF